MGIRSGQRNSSTENFIQTRSEELFVLQTSAEA